MQNTSVSVVVPCYNQVSYVEAAIASAYDQSSPPVEVIVVDDGSTDGSWELLEKLKKSRFPALILLSHPNRMNCGESVSRVKGVMAAKGDFVAFLDSDDQFMPDKLRLQLEAFDAHPSLVLCHTAVRVIGDLDKTSYFEAAFAGSPAKPYSYRDQPDYLTRCRICASSVLAKKSALQRIQFGFISAVRGFPDFACWCLLAAQGRFLFLDEPLTCYRAHGDSHTASLSVYGVSLSVPEYYARKIKSRYASLEMLMVLLVRSESVWHSLRVLAALLENFRLLMISYLWDPSPDPTDRHGLHSVVVNPVMKAILLPFKILRSLRDLSSRLAK
jgi:glycosyltransferase involved in cell wall biosynthesis